MNTINWQINQPIKQETKTETETTRVQEDMVTSELSHQKVKVKV